MSQEKPPKNSVRSASPTPNWQQMDFENVPTIKDAYKNPVEQLSQQMDNLTIEEEKKDCKPAKKQKKKPPTVPQTVPMRTRARAAAFFGGQPKAQKVGYVYDDQMLLHRDFRDKKHPERPERLMSVYMNLVKKDLLSRDNNMFEIDSAEATREELLLVHPSNHVQSVMSCGIEKKKGELLGPKANQREFASDTYTNKFTTQSALIAAGSTIAATRSVCGGYCDTAFAIVRPPGHHAHGAAVGGFCFFNNAALAARIAQKEFNLPKVCIFDWDVHVGDGTSAIFANDPSVLYISIHRFDHGKFYPGPAGKHEKIGEGSGKGYNIHFPFNVQDSQKDLIGDKDYIFALENVFLPVIKEFAPDFMIISAGFDSAKGDPLGGVAVSPEGYAYMTHKLRKIQKLGIAVLEGGYDLEALAVSSEAVVRALKIDPQADNELNKLLVQLNPERPGLTLEVMEKESLMHVREQFKQTASNLAKLLKKQWSCLVPLIVEKSRKSNSRRNSNASEGSSMSDAIGNNNQSEGSKNNNDKASKFMPFGHLSGEINSNTKLNAVARKLSQQDELTDQLLNMSLRSRAPSYVVDQPTLEDLAEDLID